MKSLLFKTTFALKGEREKSIDSVCNDYIPNPIKKDDLEILILMHFENLKSSITT